MYYTVIKHDGHLRTRGKCRKQEPQVSVFYISRVFSNVRSVLSQCNTWLRLLHLLYDIEVMWRKTLKHAFSTFYTLIKHRFLTNQSVHRILSIIYIYISVAEIHNYCRAFSSLLTLYFSVLLILFFLVPLIFIRVLHIYLWFGYLTAAKG